MANNQAVCLICGTAHPIMADCDPVAKAEAAEVWRVSVAEIIASINPNRHRLPVRRKTDDEIDDAHYRAEGWDYVPGSGWR